MAFQAGRRGRLVVAGGAGAAWPVCSAVGAGAGEASRRRCGDFTAPTWEAAARPERVVRDEAIRADGWVRRDLTPKSAWRVETSLDDKRVLPSSLENRIGSQHGFNVLPRACLRRYNPIGLTPPFFPLEIAHYGEAPSPTEEGQPRPSSRQQQGPQGEAPEGQDLIAACRPTHCGAASDWEQRMRL